MASAPDPGLLISSHTPAGDVVQLARLAEELGYVEIWLPEDYFANGGIATAAAVLSHTQRVRVGLGIVSALVRHPAVLAMEVASLEAMFPGRLTFGVGAGVPSWTERMRLHPKSPLGSVRQCVTAVNELLSGQTLDRDDAEFGFRDVTLDRPCGPVPIAVGAIGPKMLHLSGQIADVTVLSVSASAAYITWARTHVEAGLAAAGRDPADHRIAAYTYCHVDADHSAARAEMRPILARLLAAMPGSPLFEAAGLGDEIAARLGEVGPDALARDMPDHWVDALAVAGPPEHCAARVSELMDAGADRVVVAPVGSSAVATMRSAARALIG